MRTHTGECVVSAGCTACKRYVRASKFIRNELRDLDVPTGSVAWNTVFNNAIEAADIMSTVKLKRYIEEYVESMGVIYA